MTSFYSRIDFIKVSYFFWLINESYSFLFAFLLFIKSFLAKNLADDLESSSDDIKVTSWYTAAVNI